MYIYGQSLFLHLGRDCRDDFKVIGLKYLAKTNNKLLLLGVTVSVYIMHLHAIIYILAL